MAGKKTIRSFDEWNLSEGITGRALKCIKNNYNRAFRRDGKRIIKVQLEDKHRRK